MDLSKIPNRLCGEPYFCLMKLEKKPSKDKKDKVPSSVNIKPKESVPESTIFIQLAANTSKNSAAPSIKSFSCVALLFYPKLTF